MESTIACLSTPLGRGAISIVRMSGPQSLQIAKKLFCSKKLNFNKILPRYLYLGHFDLGQSMKERCLMVFFKGPNSYTGEDMIEFQVHGGTMVATKVLDRIIEFGAKLAQPGELSKRAFENGKISLDQAEAIADEINAESESELKASLSTAQGQTFRRAVAMQEMLTDLLAQIEATLDYPEEDFENDVKNHVFNCVSNIKKQIIEILDNSSNAKFTNEGVKIAILGAPNVGKSSLLNALVGTDKAIVTNIAGTTRDVVDEQIIYNGFKFKFYDTAGIRESSDIVEKIGIERSKKAAENSDIALVVLDGSKKLDDYDNSCLNLVKDKMHLIIINKTDLPRKVESFEKEIEVSALNNTNMEKILSTVYNLVIKDVDYNKLVVTNTRVLEKFNEAVQCADKVLSQKEQSMDIISMLIKEIWTALGKITGKTENEEIIDRIFAKFCLGK